MKKFIAYFDILGYGDRINDKSIDEEYKIQKEFIDDRINLIDSVSEIAKCSAIHFSDTHIFYSEDNSENSFDKIVRSSLLFMLIAAVRSTTYLPLRGAISCGDFLVDREKWIIIGQGLREAYALAERQEWMGCSLSDSCYEQAKNFRIFNIFLEKLILINYSVPFKERREYKYVINMESFIRLWGEKCKNMPLTDPEFIKNIFINKGMKDSKLLVLNKGAQKKLENTQEFFEYIKKILDDRGSK